MPPKDTDLNKTVFMAENGEDYDVIGGVTEINISSGSVSPEVENIDERIAAVNKEIKKVSSAIREFNVTLKWSSKQQGRILEVLFPKYKLTEWIFPKKKPRGTMRRKRREKRRLA